MSSARTAASNDHNSNEINSTNFHLVRQISILESQVQEQATRLKKQDKVIKKLRRQLSLEPDKPKHTTPPYFYYLGEHRTPFVQEHPELSFSEVGRALSAKWNSMSEQQKQPYLAMTEKDKERYKKESNDRLECTSSNVTSSSSGGVGGNSSSNRNSSNPNSSNSSSNRISSNSSSSSSTSSSTASSSTSTANKKHTTKRYKAGLPKRSVSAYIFYTQQRRPELQVRHPDWNFIDISRNLGQEWRSMDDVTKGPFLKLNAVDKKRYTEQMIRFRNGEQFDKEKNKKSSMFDVDV
jgi:hypothetical protein